MESSKELKAKTRLKRERYVLLKRVEEIIEPFMIFLGVIWLVLLVVELIRGLPQYLQTLGTIIWIIFILDFLLKFFLAPAKWTFLKKNVLTLISLIFPALRFLRLTRFLRVLRFARATRSLRLVKVIGSINRSVKTLSKTMKRRAFGYVTTLTLVVLFLGAAGMYAFEKDVETGFKSYWSALWWTAMLLTSIASEYWPKTTEGQTLCLVLSLFGFAVFGYFTAFLATFFLGQDAQNEEGEVAGAEQIKQLQKEVQALRMDLKEILAEVKNHKN